MYSRRTFVTAALVCCMFGTSSPAFADGKPFVETPGTNKSNTKLPRSAKCAGMEAELRYATERVKNAKKTVTLLSSRLRDAKNEEKTQEDLTDDIAIGKGRFRSLSATERKARLKKEEKHLKNLRRATAKAEKEHADGVKWRDREISDRQNLITKMKAAGCKVPLY
ncbi:MAG: hypothetical protein K8F59_06750 [Rhodobacteraceae bacterium]|nr:hypothetical protein [Paracoccaceae bacterium]